MKPKVLVLRTAGTNCDEETAFAFAHFGGQVDLIHMTQLASGKTKLRDYHILAIPGGFTYGDDIESGRILANELIVRLGEDMCAFIGDKKLVLGICNGFQVLTKSGILPGPLDKKEADAHNSNQKATLTFNDSNKFEDRWVHLKPEGKSVWTKDLKPVVYFPVAHAEGKFATEGSVLNKLKQNGQVAFRYITADGGKPVYPANPNGAMEDIAGITDRTGRVLGLMPHPERHFIFEHHPYWTRLPKNGKYGDGAQIFKNGIEYVKKTFA